MANDDPVTHNEAPPPKRRRFESLLTNYGNGHHLSPSRSAIRFSHADYTIGWVCALPRELGASKAILDRDHPSLQNCPGDVNTYFHGEIHGHNVVMACLPNDRYGLENAGMVASNMIRSYPSIRFQLLVGTGGGLPDGADVRLGDVVVGSHGVQHDLGKATTSGQFQLVGASWGPPFQITTAISSLRADHINRPARLPFILASARQLHPSSTPEADTRENEEDVLYRSEYAHVELGKSCREGGCDSSMRLERQPPRKTATSLIHYGTIASGNQLIRNAEDRRKLMDTYKKTFCSLPNLLCVEMEGAGLRNLPHLNIRGICNYADSHKNKDWKPYAAAAAVAFAKEVLSFVPQIEGSTEPFLYPNSIQELTPNRTQLLPDRLKGLLKSLSFKDIDSRLDSIKEAHSETCKWLLQDSRYLEWLDREKLSQHRGFLWIKGKPGAGKSTMMKFLVNNINSSIESEATVVTFFFNAGGNELEKSTPGMYRSLLLQLLMKFPQLQEIMPETPEDSEQDEDRWKLPLLRKLLSSAISKISQGPVVFFIDALDGCHEQQIHDMVEDFERFTAEALRSNFRLYVCFSTRHYPFVGFEAGVEVVLEDNVGHDADLEKYTRSKLLGISKSSQVKQVISYITEKACGVFLWVVRIVDIVRKEIGRGHLHKIKDIISGLPPDISDLYRGIILGNDANRDTLLRCIQWILFAETPLRPEEFYFAVISATAESCLSDCVEDWAREPFPHDDMQKFVVGSSKGLAEVTRSEAHPTVQFIHGSVRDFFLKENGLVEMFPGLAPHVQSACHNELKLCCEKYISTADAPHHMVRDKSLSQANSAEVICIRNRLPRKFPFLKYVSRYLLVHANSAAENFDQRQFLLHFDLQRWVRVFNSVAAHNACPFSASTTMQQVAAIFNLGNFFARSIMFGRQRGSPKLSLTSLLLQAADHGSTDVVRVLLQSGAGIDAKDKRGMTSLILAASKGHKTTTDLLISRGANVRVTDKVRFTPLHRACEHGMNSSVRLLVEKGADPEAQSNSGQTPLLAAISNKRDSTAQTLLETGLQNCTDSLALAEAAVRNLQGTVRVLIDRGTEVNMKCGGHGNALQAASFRGYLEIVQILLENGAEVNAQGGIYGNALQAASSRGNNEVVKLLLESGAEVNAQGGRHNNALQAARDLEHKDVERLLLDAGARGECFLRS